MENDWDEQQEAAGMYGPTNEMCDGEYDIRIDSIEYHDIEKGEKAGDALIELLGAVVGGVDDGAAIKNVWYLAQDRSNDMTLKDFNTFLAAAAIEVKVKQLQQSAICSLFNHKVLHAKLESRSAKGKEYKSWKYWKGVEGATGGDTQTATELAPDVNLDVDPFKENL